jgi:predicted TIM-barrel fold metal-dependent hydrolase
MKKIDFEAHFFSRGHLKALADNPEYPSIADFDDVAKRRLWHTRDVPQPYGDPLLNSLSDMAGKRIAVMDECGIDVQILSVSAPSIDQFDPGVGVHLAVESNNELAGVIKRHDGRFLGYAVLAPKAPEAAADELERAVTELGFVGWNTHSNIGGAYLDEERFLPIFSKAEQLDIPIYLHPTIPAFSQARTYGFPLAGPALGFGMEVCLTMLRLIYSGLFDRHPRLKIILGHLGEGLPFIMERIDWAYVRPFAPELRPKNEKRPSDYLRKNVWVTTSGNYYKPAFMCTAEAFGLDRILLGTDYPYEESRECIEFIEGLPLSDSEREKIYYRNAGQLGIAV